MSRDDIDQDPKDMREDMSEEDPFADEDPYESIEEREMALLECSTSERLTSNRNATTTILE